MLRQRLVRQCALNNSVSIEITADTNHSGNFRQLSSDSLDSLPEPDTLTFGDRQTSSSSGRRHTVACSSEIEYDIKKSISSVFESTLRRISGSFVSHRTSVNFETNLESISTTSLSDPKVMLPPSLQTFHPGLTSNNTKPCESSGNAYDVNRRFSTDFPPPTYKAVTTQWKSNNEPSGDSTPPLIKTVNRGPNTPMTGHGDLQEVVSE